MKKFLDTIGRHISLPMNPYLISAIGAFSVVWSFYLFIPKQVKPANTYSLFVDYHFREAMFVFAFGLGVWLFSVPLWAKTVQKMVMPLRFLSLFWLFIAGFTAVGNWTTGSVPVYVFLSLFCMLSAANFSVNGNHPEYRNIFR